MFRNFEFWWDKQGRTKTFDEELYCALIDWMQIETIGLLAVFDQNAHPILYMDQESKRSGGAIDKRSTRQMLGYKGYLFECS